MIRQRDKAFNSRVDAQRDFEEYTRTMMKDIVWTGTCRIWCKSIPLRDQTVKKIADQLLVKKGTDGKVTALWSGS